MVRPEVDVVSNGLLLPVSDVVSNKEVQDTVLLAKSLGAENMEKFEGSIAKAVNKEGFQLVDK